MRRRVAGATLVVCLVAAVVIVLGPVPPGRSASSAPQLTSQPDLGVPFAPITFDGMPSNGQPGEVDANDETNLIRYTTAHGWQQLNAPVDSTGQPLTGFRLWGFERPMTPGSFGVGGLQDPGSASVTPDGGMAAFGCVWTPDPYGGSCGTEQVVVSMPGGGAVQALPAPSTSILPTGQVLAEPSISGGHPAIAAVDEPGGGTGVFIAPTSTSNPPTPATNMLYWNGHQWSDEPIVGKSSFSTLTPIAVKATSPSNAWMLAEGPTTGSTIEPILLFQRTVSGSSPQWKQVPLTNDAGVSSSPFAAGNANPNNLEVRSFPDTPLTVTSQGVWVDFTWGTLDNNPQGYLTGTQGGTFYVDTRGDITGSWCDDSSVCANSLGEIWGNPNTPATVVGSQSPESGYASFAFPGVQYGTRVITNAQNGDIAEFDGSQWHRIALPDESAFFSGAFSSIDNGWIAGQPPIHVTTSPAPDETQLQTIPGQEPLLAAASEPGQPVGSLNTPAIAVGAEGSILRYTPGQGWNAEAIIDPGTGVRDTTTLRGVAWPTPDYAIAVGDGGAVFSWSSSRGSWQPDASRPGDLTENLNGVAFDPSDPNLGYIVGMDGTLLKYDKTLQQQQLPATVASDNLISVAFAGSQALVVGYQSSNSGSSRTFSSALLENSGGGWTVDQQLASLLAQTPDADITAVAGLPDGGAVVAGNGFVAERNSPSDPWTELTPPAQGTDEGPFGLNLSAVSVAAYRDSSGQIQALLDETTDFASYGYPFIPQASAPPDPNEPAPQEQPISFPDSGYLLQQTNTGWEDEQHSDITLGSSGGHEASQYPWTSDAIRSLSLIGPDGSGWAVGGNSGVGTSGLQSSFQNTGGAKFPADTAAVFRYPLDSNAAPLPSAQGTSAIPQSSGTANFAIAGGAEQSPYSAPGSGLAGDAMIQRMATQVSGLGSGGASPRAVLYPGSSQNPGVLVDTGTGAPYNDGDSANPTALAREANFGSLFSKPFYSAPSAGDAAQPSGSLSQWMSALDGAPAPQGVGSLPSGFSTSGIPGAAPTSGDARTHYAFDTDGAGGKVRVIVVDVSAATGDPSPSQENPIEGQTAWVTSVLQQAKSQGIPAIVVGNAPLTDEIIQPGQELTDQDIPGNDALNAFAKVLADNGASAYFFETPEQNRVIDVPQGAANAIPSYGTGSLDYGGGGTTDYSHSQTSVRHDEPGFLLAEVKVANRNPSTNVAPVNVRLIPVISQLTINPVDGTTLQRGSVGLFQGLGRKPLAGYGGGQSAYTDFPQNVSCPAATGCSTAIFPEYHFTSSDPDIGNFVETDPNANSPRQPLLGSDGKPVPSDTSDLFCAYNAGTTTITIQAGGLSYSTKVTVAGGSPKRPCGTVPLNASRFPPARQTVSLAPNPSAPGATPATPAASHNSSQPPSPALVPAPPAPAHVSPPAISPPPAHAASTPPSPAPPPPAPPYVPAQVIPPILAVPLPNPPVARPIPPAGTAQVQVPAQVTAFGNVPAAREEREEEVAPEDVQAASAYRPGSSAPMVPIVLGVIIVAAAAGSGLRRGRGGGREVRPVPIALDDRARPPRRR